MIPPDLQAPASKNNEIGFGKTVVIRIMNQDVRQGLDSVISQTFAIPFRMTVDVENNALESIQTLNSTISIGESMWAAIAMNIPAHKLVATWSKLSLNQVAAVLLLVHVLPLVGFESHVTPASVRKSAGDRGHKNSPLVISFVLFKNSHEAASSPSAKSRYFRFSW